MENRILPVVHQNGTSVSVIHRFKWDKSDVNEISITSIPCQDYISKTRPILDFHCCVAAHGDVIIELFQTDRKGVRDLIKRISPEAMAEIDRLARKIKEHNDAVRDSTGRPLTACVKTFGCQMNEHDSEKLRGMLKRMGYDIVPDFLMGDGATVPDVVLFNTCCVRENAEDRIFGQIGAIKGAKRLKSDMIVAVCGCMTEQGWVVDRIKKSYRHVDIVLGTGNTYRLPEVMAAKIFDGRRTIGLESEDSVPEGIEADRDEKFRAYVTIMYGCDNFCSYCIVPYVRGRERSRRPDDIINEIRGLTESGTKEVMLLGQNVNSYGKGLET